MVGARAAEGSEPLQRRAQNGFSTVISGKAQLRLHGDTCWGAEPLKSSNCEPRQLQPCAHPKPSESIPAMPPLPTSTMGSGQPLLANPTPFLSFSPSSGHLSFCPIPNQFPFPRQSPHPLPVWLRRAERRAAAGGNETRAVCGCRALPAPAPLHLSSLASGLGAVISTRPGRSSSS